MEKTILVTGKDTFLGNEIGRFFLEQECNISSSITLRPESTVVPVEESDKLMVFPWNKRSAIGAKNFVLQTLNRFETISQAWLIITPERSGRAFPDDVVGSVDDSIDQGLKGFVYLLRELLLLQAKKTDLELHVVLFDEERGGQGPLESLQYQAMKGLISNLLVGAKKKGRLMWAYESALPEPDLFAKWVLQLPRGVTPKSAFPGKWYMFDDKKSLFGGFFSKKNNNSE